MPERTLRQKYEDFYLLISAGEAGSYPVTVVSSPSGEACGTLTLDPNSDAIQRVLARIEEGETNEDVLLSFGQHLFDSLFTNDIEDALRDSLGRVGVLGTGLRLRLRIDPPELASLPWEYLLDPRNDVPLAISPQFTLSRWVQTPRPSDRPWPADLPLRVLVVISCPKDVMPLDIAREKQVLRDVFDELIERGRVNLEFLDQAVIEEVQIRLNRYRPHIFHFIGHGVFQRDQAHLILENDDGTARPASDRDIRDLFLGAQDTRLVVLNACQGGTTSSANALVGLAPRLMQRGLPSVVAMQHETPDETAVVFARGFYLSIAEGKPVDVAMAQARCIIRLKFGLGRRDWGTPVLFMRSRDGIIFDTSRWETQSPSTDTRPSVTLEGVPRLRVTIKDRTRDYPLIQPTTVIGRSPESDICLPLGYVSQAHAEVRQEDDRFVIEDLDSSNGTWFQGQTIAEHELDDGDTLTIGEIRLTFLAPVTQEKEGEERKTKPAKTGERIRLWDEPEKEEPPPDMFSRIRRKLDQRD